MNENMTGTIGLTGGIASGKSTVSGMLADLGALILDADQYSRDATEPSNPCFDRIVSMFGCQILSDSGTISRKVLASIVFGDSERRLALNGIIHPYVLSRLCEETDKERRQQNRVIVWDVPLLLEVGWEHYVSCVWMVVADAETRAKRIITRDGVCREDAMRRISAQMSDMEKCRRADCVLMNQGSREQLQARVAMLYQEFCR